MRAKWMDISTAVERQVPEWALAIERNSIAGEYGIIATIERTVGPIGSDAFKLWFAETFGVFSAACNCQSIRAQWLSSYRYPLTSTPK